MGVINLIESKIFAGTLSFRNNKSKQFYLGLRSTILLTHENSFYNFQN